MQYFFNVCAGNKIKNLKTLALLFWVASSQDGAS